ncbi:phytoene desaturase family protein [Cellulomonas carbonis]|uniref:Pyridine nucleotide-disulfide oxidoreductase domain-containing protein 2 n=1 Tax=Cellulomonas carbonis T26 TaxID=947969 RepID=A0A0A0BUB8_9CELL|nr:NAD(P)/FAD-dependent oxidoreductase [Cellulomonas carbonis]KGM12013.1 FAD-dependent oxidoreductase [Cellulomonas carbonis T26]GGB98391.1 oxidoreductase [Cellulomonas carbonis]
MTAPDCSAAPDPRPTEGPDQGRRLARARPEAPTGSRYDVVVVGGGHNGLTAAAYLARAGRSVLVLEARDHLGGATGSARVFPGVDANLSRYSYLVSLMPEAVRRELGLRLELRRRRWSSYTPLPDDPSRGLLVDAADSASTARSLERVGAGADAAAWEAFSSRTGALAGTVFPTVTGPLPTAAEMRRSLGAWWEDLVERPLGELVERTFTSDVVRGVVLTDALIGTFASAHDAGLAQNRCFLYHVVGGGTGDWDVPVGGMGAVVRELERVCREGGAELVVGARATAVDPGADGVDVHWADDGGRTRSVRAQHVLAGCAPHELDRLLGRTPRPLPEGSQLKVNMVLDRLPRLRDAVDPAHAFAGTFHVNEGYAQLGTAHREAAAGCIPSVPPLEIYCHSLTDGSILGPADRAAGRHTLTLFGLHIPARLFRQDPDGARAEAVAATLRSLDAVLAEPVEECLATDADGRPCLEARTPVDLEGDVGLPGGHIFHGDLQWPWLAADADPQDPATRWGVATGHPRVLLCGAGAVRGGGVSGIPGRSAAMALLGD